MKRFHFIRFLCCTFCCALSILQCFSSQAEQSQSYSTLRTECPDAFQYSTTVGNAVINVDAPILLPDTHSIPLLRLRWIMYDEAYNNRRIISAGNTSDLAMHNNIYYSRFIIASDQAPALIFCPMKQPTRWNSYVRPMAYRRIFAFGRNMPPVGCMPSPTALPPMKPHLCDKTSL